MILKLEDFNDLCHVMGFQYSTIFEIDGIPHLNTNTMFPENNIFKLKNIAGAPQPNIKDAYTAIIREIRSYVEVLLKKGYVSKQILLFVCTNKELELHNVTLEGEEFYFFSTQGGMLIFEEEWKV